MLKRYVMVAISAIAIGLGTTVAAEAQDKPLIIGMAIAQSGWMTAYDNDPAAAVEIAVDDINKAGGILGRQLKLIYSDTKTDPTQAYNAGLEVLTKGAELVVASCDFDMGGPAAVAAQKAGVVAISLCSGSPKWGPQGVGPLAFSMGAAAQVEGYLMAEWAYKKQGWKTAYMLKDTSLTYSRAKCAGFEARWTEIAGKDALVGFDTFKNDDPSIASQITRIKNLEKAPDALFICTYTPGGATVIRQLRNAGVTLPILEGWGMDGQYWVDAVPELSNFYNVVFASAYGDDPRKEVRDFTDRFTKRFGKPPATGFAVLGYSLIEAFKKAAERAGTTKGDKVAAELMKFNEEPLLAGPWTFTKDIHIQNQVTGLMMTVQDGKFQTLGEFYRNEKPVPLEMLFRE